MARSIGRKNRSVARGGRALRGLWLAAGLFLVLDTLGHAQATAPHHAAASRKMLAASAESDSAHGSFEQITVHGEALEGNLLGDTASPEVGVYLPPGYAAHPAERYPVVYFLHGFTDSEPKWFNPPPAAKPEDRHPSMPELADAAIATGAARKLIIVMPNAFNTFHGSWYSTSAATGDWEGYLTRDLVHYIDAHYRTLATPASRGLAGHSMGGYGTLRIGLRHPEVFSSIYAMSPFGVMWGEEFMPTPDGPIPAVDAVRSLPAIDRLEFRDLATMALSAAWSPDPGRPPFFLDLPDGSGRPHLTTLARWSANLVLAQLDQDLPRTRLLHAIAFDAGRADEFKSIPPGVQALDQSLTENKIRHSFELYDGTHNGRVAERIKTRVLPFFSQNLSFKGSGE